MIIFCVIVWTVWGWRMWQSGDLARRAQWADSFGALNALATLLVMAGTLYAVSMQRQELQRLRQQQAEEREQSALDARLAATAALGQIKATMVSAQLQASLALFSTGISANMTADGTRTLVDNFQNLLKKVGMQASQLEELAKELEQVIRESRPEKGRPPAG